MHEYSIVEQLVEKLLEELQRQGITQVKEVHLRRGSTFAEGPLQQAFNLLSNNTPLEGSTLVVEEYKVEHTCKGCGFQETVTSDDLLGHLYVCSQCGAAEEISEAHGLELLGVKVEDSGE